MKSLKAAHALAIPRDLSFLRLGDWLVKYSPVLAGILVLITTECRDYLWEICATILFSASSFCYAFSLNYYLEREIDERVGKNRVRGVNGVWAYTIFILLTTTMLAVPLVMKNTACLGIAIFCVIMSTLYSAKPVYFKARPVLGIISQALFLEVPHFLFFALLINYTHVMHIWFISGWLFLFTAKGALIHQILDYTNDLQVEFRTLPVYFGLDTSVTVADVLFWSIFVYALSALMLFDMPTGLILFLLLVLSNSKYKNRGSEMVKR